MSQDHAFLLIQAHLTLLTLINVTTVVVKRQAEEVWKRAPDKLRA